MNNKFQFTHQEAVKYVKTMLAYFGITEYDLWEKSWEQDHEYFYGSHSEHNFARFYGLPAPFGIGHIKIEVFDAAVSFRLTINQEEKLDEEGKKLYETDILKTSDDVWFIDLKNFSVSDRIVESRSGYNRGHYIDEHTIGKFNELFNILYGNEYKTNHIVKLAADSYEQNREFMNFIELASHAWNIYPDLWNCINKFSTQYSEISSIWLHNKFEDLVWYDVQVGK